MRKIASLVIAGIAGIAMATPAAAHVTVQPTEAPVGSFFRFVVRVPNERDVPTTKVEVQMPETLVFMSFQPKEGWKRTVKMKKLDEPIEVFGEEVDEVVGSVVWSGGRIGVGEFDEFGFSAKVPDEEATLEFPAIQTYAGGEVVRWIGPPDSEEPAGLVNVVDIGAAEGEGPLAITADLAGQMEDLRGSGSEESDDDEDGGGGLALLLGALGTLLGAIALGLSLRKRSA